MFDITVPVDFKKADNQPFRKVKRDEAGEQVEKLDKDGKPFLPPQFELEEASYSDMLSWFLNNVFDLVAMKAREDKATKHLTYEDSAFATDIFRAIHVTEDGVLELEKAPKEWLEKILVQYGTDLFGVNAAVMVEPLKKAVEGSTTRAERKRDSKQKTKEPANS